MHKPAESGISLTTVNGRVQNFAEHIRTNRPAGVDLATPMYTKLYAVEDGYRANKIDQYGANYVCIWNENRLWLYVHLNSFEGIDGNVRKGDIVGYAGSTGWSTGAHTHWELRINNVRKDPISYYLAHSGDPDLYHLMSVFRPDVAENTTEVNVYEAWWVPFGHKELLYHLGVLGRTDVISELGTDPKKIRDWYVDFGYKEHADIWLRKTPYKFHTKF